MANSSLYKVLVVGLLAWAVLSTVTLAYYYNLYLDLLMNRESLIRKLEEFDATLGKLKQQLTNLTQQLNTYNESYQDLLRKFRLSVERSVAIVVFDYGNGTIERHKVYFIEGINNTVFNVTVVVADLNYTYYAAYNDYFINGINGVNNRVVNATSGYYWLFYVNFRLSDKGAYQTKVYDGDVIIWNYTYVSWG